MSKNQEQTPIMAPRFRKTLTSWNDFLHKSIYMDHGVTNILERHQAISFFVREGLIPFVSKKGFTWRYRPEEITRTLLNLLFVMFEGKKIKIPNRQAGYSPEYFTLFLERLDSEEWEHFWGRWGVLEDFDEYGYAYELRFHLQNYVWNSVDLDRSPATQDLLDELEERAETEKLWRNDGDRSKGKDDPYLQDLQQGTIAHDKHIF